MTTVPDIPQFDDWRFDFLSLTTGAVLGTGAYLNGDILDIKGISIPGVTADRLESADMTVRARDEAGNITQSAKVLQDNKLVMFRAVPYADEALAMYGLAIKPKLGYDQRGVADNIDVHIVGIEYLLHSREVYHWDGTSSVPISIAAGKPDDLMKKLVRYTALAGTCSTDADGNSRDWGWGTLAVQADAAESSDTITLEVYRGYLDEALRGLADKYGIDWELRPSISGGAVTFTFNTKLRESTDRSYGNTDGNRPIMIRDIGGLIPSATRWRSIARTVTALHSPGLTHIELNASGISDIGRWEGISKTSDTTAMQIELEQSRYQEGYTSEFDATTVSGSMSWLEDFFTGDLVSHQNARLDIAIADERIAAVLWSFPQKRLRLQIRWGDKEPGLVKSITGGKYRPRRPTEAGGYWDRNPTDATIFPGTEALLTDVVLIGQNTIPANAWADTHLDVVDNIRVGRGVYATANSLALCGYTGGKPIVHVVDESVNVGGAAGGDCRLNVFSADTERFRWDADSAEASFMSGLMYIRPSSSADNWIKIDPDNGYLDLWRGIDLRVYNDTGSTLKASIDGATGAGAFAQDADVTSYMGRAAIGYNGADANSASFAHVDHNSAASYALRQNPSGSTLLNAATGGNIFFLQNDIIYAKLTPIGFSLWRDIDLHVYSDAGNTLVASIDGATGNTQVGEYLYIGDTNTYIRRNSGSNVLRFVSDLTNITYAPGGNDVLNITAGDNKYVWPSTDDLYTLGRSTYRWHRIYGMRGVYSEEVRATIFRDVTGTAYYLDPNNATSLVVAGSMSGTSLTVSATGTAIDCSGDIVMAADKTVDGVDVSAFKTAYDAHVHAYDKVIDTTNTGHDPAAPGAKEFWTSSWTTSGYSADYSKNPVRDNDGSGTQRKIIMLMESSSKTYIRMADANDGTGADWVQCKIAYGYIGSAGHKHLVMLSATNSAAP